MASLNTEKLGQHLAAQNAKAAAELAPKPVTLDSAVKSAIAEEAAKEASKAKPFSFPRRVAVAEPSQHRAHHVYNVPPGVTYERVLQSETYRAVAPDLRPGDLLELRFEPNLNQWALLLVVALLPTGAEVRELIHRQFEDVASAASMEELTGFKAEQTGINVWKIRREVDGHLMPNEFPTQQAARAGIAELAPKFAGRGWSRSS
jgi:hypothetical protein